MSQLIQQIKQIKTDFKQVILQNSIKIQGISTLLNIDICQPKQIFKCFKYFNLNQCKVVIIGQDPYHNGQATGLSFACKNKINPSLKNIINQTKCKKVNFNLEKWACQGVLLLNSSLTVEKNKPGIHIKYWEKITDNIIKTISCKTQNVVFMLWGKYAQNKQNLINLDQHLILKAGHPSPLNFRNDFTGCNHFEKCNLYLTKKGKKLIEWCEG